MRLSNTIRDSFIRAAMDDVPQIDYAEQIRKLMVADATAQLPPKVRALFTDKALSHFVHQDWAYVSNTREYLPFGRGDKYTATEKALGEIKALESAKEAQRESRENLRQKLRGCAYACSTRKALVDMLPEFEKYLPADEVAAARSLPVVANVVSDFVKAGWPKGTKKKASA